MDCRVPANVRAADLHADRSGGPVWVGNVGTLVQYFLTVPRGLVQGIRYIESMMRDVPQPAPPKSKGHRLTDHAAVLWSDSV